MTKRLSGARVDIPREEYDAFCYLRDVTHDDLRRKAEQLQRQVEQADLLEKQSRSVIDQQAVTLEHLMRRNVMQHEMILKLQARLAELEPVKLATPQPMFARK